MIFVKNVFIIFLIAVLNIANSVQGPQVTVPVKTRVQILKDAINQDIMVKKYNDKRAGVMFARVTPVDNADAIGNYEYEEENEKLTPIMDNDKRKLHGKHGLKKIKKKKTPPSVVTTAATKASLQENPMRNASLSDMQPAFKKIHRSFHRPNLSFKDIFYRRYLDSIPLKQVQYMHCVDLITPYLKGYKKVMTDIKRIPYDGGVVLRLTQLLTEDHADHTKDDIRSIMYQISNVNIRLFQWELNAMKKLLFTLTHEKKYSFKNIKYGLRQIFSTWQLDLSNTTNLVKQARIFRPPCVVITPNTGSTKQVSSTSFTRPTPPKPKIPCLEYSREDDRKDCASFYY